MTSPFLPPDFPEIVLASRSPRRADILHELGVAFVVEPAPEAVERNIEADDPLALPLRAAIAKVRVVAARNAGRIVLAADTVVVVDGDLLNKPVDDDEARSFMECLAGRTHTVATGVAVAVGAGAGEWTGTARTDVTFRALTPMDVRRYIATGEGRDKAGSYAAQGLGAGLIEQVDGCFFNVVGLPVALTLSLLRKAVS